MDCERIDRVVRVCVCVCACARPMKNVKSPEEEWCAILCAVCVSTLVDNVFPIIVLRASILRVKFINIFGLPRCFNRVEVYDLFAASTPREITFDLRARYQFPCIRDDQG